MIKITYIKDTIPWDCIQELFNTKNVYAKALYIRGVHHYLHRGRYDIITIDGFATKSELALMNYFKTLEQYQNFDNKRQTFHFHVGWH
jgi:hypothetical protein